VCVCDLETLIMRWPRPSSMVIAVVCWYNALCILFCVYQHHLRTSCLVNSTRLVAPTCLQVICCLQLGQSPRFEYLVRLDALSSPSVYQECGTKPTCRVVEGQGGDGVPQGFAKIRVQGEGAEDWAEFINAAGFLRRSVRLLK
jgi:hypothetical protein